MNEMKILQAMEMVDDEYLEEMNMENKKEPGRKRNVLKLFLVAALVAVLGVGVLAHEYEVLGGKWFYSFFSSDNRMDVMGKLTENQKEVLNRGMVEINQSMTVDGWTVTFESGISDGYHMLVKYRIDAPESVVLDGRYSLDFWADLKTAEGKTVDWNGPFIAQWMIQDEDPNDNSITKLIDWTVNLTSDAKALSVPEGAVLTLEVRNIWKNTGNAENFAREKMFEKDCKFEVELGEVYLAKDTVELTETTYCAATRRYKDLEFDMKLKVTSVELRTLSASIKFEMPMTGRWDGIWIKPITIVLKDGTAMESQSSSLKYLEDHIECIVTFDRPVPLADVAYIDFH